MALQLIRDDLKTIDDYLIKDELLDYKLDANESPWAPINLKQLKLNRYPALGPQNRLQQSLADNYGVNKDELVITRGSDEGIDLLMRLFLKPMEDSIIQCPPTFFMYSFYARMQGAGLINCPLKLNNDCFDLDMETITTQWQSNCKLIFLCRPNNPTGSMISLDNIRLLCEQFNNKAMIVVDEAYIEFSGFISASSLIKEFNNLIVLRTLSKAYGLAGLRLGAILGNTPLIKAIQKIITPFSLASPVIQLGIRALKNKAWFDEKIETIIKLKMDFILKLKSFAFIDTIYESFANFVLIKSTYAKELYLWLRENNIAIRAFFDNPILNQHLRITIGSKKDNEFLFNTLNLFKA